MRMATVTGLKVLQKNISLNTALRLGNFRNKRLPKRIINYSRFATQLNFLRYSDRMIHPEMADDYLEKSTNEADSDKTDLNTPPAKFEVSDHATISSNHGDDRDGQTKGDSIKLSDVVPLFRDQQEYAENSYIYRHIHKRLDKYADIGQSITQLPVNKHIEQLDQLVDKKNFVPALEYKKQTGRLIFEIQGYIKTMNQQELAILLTAIKSNHSQEFRTVKNIIDLELRWLLKKHVKTRLMDLNLWFYLADVFYESLIKSSFVHVFVNYLVNEKEVVMSNSQFLHLLFLVILKRHQDDVLKNYEQRIVQILRKASVVDIATICLAYFKTQTQITNREILIRVIDSTADNLDTVDFKQPGYCSIIKCIRYSRNLECRENVLHLMMTLVHDHDCEAIFSNPYNAVHTIKMMESYRIYDPKLLNLIVSTMFKNLDRFRIKDIQYALTSLSNFGYKIGQIEGSLKKNFDRLCDDIVSETRYDTDKQTFHILPILRAFTVLNYYNDKLINYTSKLFDDPNEVQIMSKVLEFERTVLLIYTATRLEGQGAKFLSNNHPMALKINKLIDRRNGNAGSVRQDSSIKHLDFILRKKEYNHLYINNAYCDVSTALAASAKLQDPSYKFNFQYTLPHQNYADLIVSKDCLEPGQFDEETLEPKSLLKDKRYCALMGVRRFDFIDGHERLCGYKKLITRLLTKLGYKVLYFDLNEPDVDNLACKVKSALTVN